LTTKPEPIDVDLGKSAVVVVDMQNAFASKKGMLDIAGAFFLDYWPILIADATMAAGPPAMQEATLFNIEPYFGWTIPSKEFLKGI
jgi:nicotinamidase-related amidase